MRSDPMCWQLSLPVKYVKGEMVVAPDTAKNRNARFKRMDRVTGTTQVVGGAGVVYDHDGRGNLGQNTYQARRIAACTVRRFDTTPGTKLVTGAELAARRPSRSNGWAR